MITRSATASRSDRINAAALGLAARACASSHVVLLIKCPERWSANSSALQNPGASASSATAKSPNTSITSAAADGLTSIRISRTSAPLARRAGMALRPQL